MRRVVLGLVIGALIGSLVIWRAGVGAGAHQPRAGANDLTHQEQHPGMGLTLDPPPQGLQVPITEQRALDIAWSQDQPDNEPTSREADLALLTKAGYDKSPVWMVRYSGVCVPVGGPPNLESPGAVRLPHCGSEWDVLVDAESGAFILGFSDHDDGEAPRS